MIYQLSEFCFIPTLFESSRNTKSLGTPSSIIKIARTIIIEKLRFRRFPRPFSKKLKRGGVRKRLTDNLTFPFFFFQQYLTYIFTHTSSYRNNKHTLHAWTLYTHLFLDAHNRRKSFVGILFLFSPLGKSWKRSFHKKQFPKTFGLKKFYEGGVVNVVNSP